MDRTKKQHHEKKDRIDELEKIVRILKNDKIKFDEEMKKLQTDKQLVEEKLKEATNTASTIRKSTFGEKRQTRN